MVVLKRVDPEESMNRFYTVTVQPTLLDPVAVVYAWGSRESSQQQVRVLPMASQVEAEALAEKMVRQKCKRGYVVVEDGGGEG